MMAMGCSAIVNPDETLLGEAPDGGPGDTGTGDADRPDADRPDADRPDADRPDADPPDGMPPDTGMGPPCRDDSECDDGAFCNGAEACDPSSPAADARGCVAGMAPACGDGVPCTSDSCDEDTDSCVNAADDTLCDDGIDCSDDICRPSAGRADERGCIYNERNSRCSSTDFCMAGTVCSIAAGGCTGGTPRDCRDGDICHGGQLRLRPRHVRQRRPGRGRRWIRRRDDRRHALSHGHGLRRWQPVHQPGRDRALQRDRRRLRWARRRDLRAPPRHVRDRRGDQRHRRWRRDHGHGRPRQLRRRLPEPVRRRRRPRTPSTTWT